MGQKPGRDSMVPSRIEAFVRGGMLAAERQKTHDLKVTMKALFVIEQPYILKELQDPKGANPGFGGTSFTALRLVTELANCPEARCGDLQIWIGVEGIDLHSYLGIPIAELANSGDQLWDVAILTGGSIDRLHEGKLKLHTKRLLAWIRHPYDWDKIGKARRLNAEMVSVGKSQFLSNVLIGGWHHHIDNLFCAERVRRAAEQPIQLTPATSEEDRSKWRLGFMGALVPSKGFHELAEQWPSICTHLRSRGLDPLMEVIGGARLYTFDEGHPRLPCSESYGNRLESLLGQELNRSVRFHGTLGVERYRLMRTCQVAVVNPSGQGEAFPASILEWLALGIPVISSQRYGCADAMQYFPNTSILHPREVEQKIEEIIQLRQNDAERLHQHCERIADLFSSQQTFIISQWRLLLYQLPASGKINEYLPASIYALITRQWAVMLAQRIKQALRSWGRHLMRTV